MLYTDIQQSPPHFCTFRWKYPKPCS